MKIKYYKLEDYRGYNQYPESMSRNFISVERAKTEIKNVYKFEPYLSISSNNFAYLCRYKKVEQKTPVYKLYRTGRNKGGIIEKKGQKVIDYYRDDSFMEKCDDYTDCEFSESEFNQKPAFYEHAKKGFYRLKYDILPIVEKEYSIIYSAKIYIQFVRAKTTVIPEIKSPGVPYQPPSEKIEILEESEFFPLYKCKKYDKIVYGIFNNMDNFSKTEEVILYSEININENEIEIIE